MSFQQYPIKSFHYHTQNNRDTGVAHLAQGCEWISRLRDNVPGCVRQVGRQPLNWETRNYWTKVTDRRFPCSCLNRCCSLSFTGKGPSESGKTILSEMMENKHVDRPDRLREETREMFPNDKLKNMKDCRDREEEQLTTPLSSFLFLSWKQSGKNSNLELSGGETSVRF